MLKINLIEDEELRGVVNTFISALLPHENYDPSMFTTTLATLQKYIKFDEFRMEHRLLIIALVELGKIKIAIETAEPRLTRQTFEKILEASIMDAIVRPELGVFEWLKYEGLNTNLAIPTVKEDACQRVCGRALDLYDECYEMQQSSVDVINHEPELKAAFIAHTSVQCINFQSEILQGEASLGRKRYRGAVDWLQYTKKMTAEIEERVSSADSEKVLRLDSIEGSYKLLSDLSELLVPIADYGIPELDQFTPIMRHRLVVVVGKENIGKTKFAIDKAVNVIRVGGHVVYMCGESEKATVFADIMINYIFKEFGIIVRSEHLAAPSMCPDDVRKVIGMAVETVISKGGLTLCDSFNYDTLRSELDTLYENCKFDLVVIDHSCALSGTTGDGSLKAKIDKLAYDCRDFKKAYPVCVMVTSHPSVASKETAKNDRTTNDSPTKGSQNLSTEADEVFYLRDNDTLVKQNLVMLENTKRRNAGRVTEPIVLQKRFDVSAFIYSPDLQSGSTRMGLDRESALDDLDKKLGVSEEDEAVYSI